MRALLNFSLCRVYGVLQQHGGGDGTHAAGDGGKLLCNFSCGGIGISAENALHHVNAHVHQGLAGTDVLLADECGLTCANHQEICLLAGGGKVCGFGDLGFLRL